MIEHGNSILMRSFAAILILFLPLCASSQDLRYTVSDRTANNDLAVHAYAGNSSIGHYAIGMYEGVCVIAKLDTGMKMTDKHPIDKKIYSVRQASMCEFASMGNKLWFFKQVYNAKGKRFDLTAREVKTDSLTLSEPRVISSPENIPSKLAPSITIGHVFSPDSRKMLFYSPVVSDNNDDGVMYVKIMDENLNLTWEKEIQTMMNPANMKIDKVRIDDAGRIYLLVHQVIYIKRTAKVDYHLLVCRDNGTFFKDIPVDLPDHQIVNCSFDVATSGEVNILGTYSIADEDVIDGTFMINYEKNGYTAPTPFITPLSPDLVTEFGYTDKDSIRKVQARFPLYDVHCTPDGGATMLVEHDYALSQYVTSGDLQSTVDLHSVTTQYRMEILAFHYGKKWLLWQDIIYKKQSTSNEHYEHAGFNAFYHGNDTWLLYNDNVEDDQNSYEYTSGELNICKLDSAGKIFLHDLIPALPRETILLKLYSYQADEDELLLYCSSSFYLRRVRLMMN